MSLKIAQNVLHYLGRFRGAEGREFEFAVAKAPGDEIRTVGCNAFMDFGLGSCGKNPQRIYELRAEDVSGYTQYTAELNSEINPSLIPEPIWATVSQVLMHAQQAPAVPVDGMWINCSDDLVEYLGLPDSRTCRMFLEGIVLGAKVYWMNVGETKPENYVGSVIIGAGEYMYSEVLGGTGKIFSLVDTLMTKAGVLKSV